MYIYLIKLRAIAGIIPLVITLDVHITKASASTWSTLPCCLLKTWFSHSHYPCFQISNEKCTWKALLWKVKLPTASQVFWNESSIIMNICQFSGDVSCLLTRANKQPQHEICLGYSVSSLRKQNATQCSNAFFFTKVSPGLFIWIWFKRMQRTD